MAFVIFSIVTKTIALHAFSHVCTYSENVFEYNKPNAEYDYGKHGAKCTVTLKNGWFIIDNRIE